MVAFLATDLFILLKNLMSRFVKVDILKEIKFIDKLLLVQVNNSSNHLDCSKVNVGYVAERIAKDRLAPELQILEFQMSSKKCLVTIVEKLLQKSPLKFSIVSIIRFLDPWKMASSQEQCPKWLKKTLMYLKEKKRVREQDSDDVIREYGMFTEEVVASNKSLFAEFSPVAGRVDTLLYEQMSQNNSYKKIWELCRKLLLLSHGQGSVERGFSVNWQIEIENMREGTFVAKRHICDHLKAVGGIDKVIINKI